MTPIDRRGRTVILLAFAITVLVAGLVVVAVARGPSPSSGGAGARAGTSAGLTIYPEDDRTTFPTLSGPDLEGRALTTADYDGKILVVNIWGSWCGPCRAEAPALSRVAKASAADGVQFLGIDTRDNASAAQAFVDKFDLPYPSFDDGDGRVLLRLKGIAPLASVPSTVFVSRRGEVAAAAIGPVDETTLQGLVDDLLAEGG